jgi:predicted lipoprotein
MTQRQLFRELVAAKERDKHERHRDMALAWMTAKLQRAEKIPSLQTLLEDRKERQTVGQMRTVLEQLSQRYGGKVTARG